MSRLSRQVQPAEAYLAKLTDADWAALAKRDVVVKGGQGQYGLMVATTVSHAAAWAVLTDYSSFETFLPTVVKSRVVETEGDRTIVEQIDRRRIMLTTMESKVLTENLELDGQQISFRLLEGNLEYMYGHWRIDAAPPSLGRGLLCLLSQQVRAEADVGPFKALFYNLFEAGLVDTMKALRAEMERRAASPNL
ncbi:SRPBCC family protein [Nodosilinea sp. LEGE 06152]|uniref:SRPBCC family protein n=1 Tax=Nodosilinea sp. LEGE 06152 TaxID=2777966 RepID=UPI0018816BCB|nr:SRPBCC family protein [Nodosilinea sp. LEGE 06152]MBE9155506.1 SRPBCC family protein [Nodosilinea sp. LEGE 06152]